MSKMLFANKSSETNGAHLKIHIHFRSLGSIRRDHPEPHEYIHTVNIDTLQATNRYRARSTTISASAS